MRHPAVVRQYTELEVEGRVVRISTPERVLWPAVGMTTAQLIDYYIRISPVLLPHLVGRPLTLGRYPYGIRDRGFFQTRAPSHPEWVRTQRMYLFSPSKQVDAIVLHDLAGLVWAANLSTIELHPYLSYAQRLEQPEYVVFDLDPGASADRVLDRMARSLRAGKVFIDWSQNDPGKSTVAPYSVRAQDLPTISTPVTWDEVEAAVQARDWRRLVFGPGEVLDRVEVQGDLFAPTDGAADLAGPAAPPVSARG